MRSYLSIAICLFISGIALSQCGLSGSFLVPDQQFDNFIIKVSGLANNDLASSGQGVCGVELNFAHNSIGDWEVILTSPAGQSVILVGPIGLFGDTESTTWDILFTPCSDNPLPDLGFLQTWDSDQAWGDNNDFVGSYYPVDGCLENFNIGPANGSWTLFISDNNGFDEGELMGFSLIFCDDDPEQSCFYCNPDGGRLTGNAISACQDDPILNLNVSPTFQHGSPDPSLYNYFYIIVLNNSIVRVSNSPNLIGLDDGAYRVFGLSFLNADLGNLPSIGDSFVVFRNNLNSSSPDLCGNLSVNAITLDIFDEPEPLMIFDTICLGDQYIIGDSTFTTSGIKTISFQTINSCDSVVILDLAVTNFSASLTGPNSLSCTSSSVSINLSGIPLNMLDSINWFNENNTFYNDAQVSTIAVDQPGVYYAALSFRGCLDTISRTINSVNLPPLELFTDTLTCNEPIGIIEARSAANVSYEWFFNNMPFSNLPNPPVNEAGVYRVEITDPAGCQNIGSVRVRTDTIVPFVTIQGGSLSCTALTINLVLRTRANSTVFWTGPNSFSSTSLAPSISIPGIYTAVVTAENGCMNTAQVNVDDDFRPFDLDFNMDSISCSDLIANISFTSALGNVMATWVSPSSQTFNGRRQSFTEAGIYQLRIVSSDLCTKDTLIEIIADTLLPTINIIGNTELNCTEEQLLINAIVTPPSADIDWLFPDDTHIDQGNIIATLAGTYLLTTTDINGCQNIDSIRVTYGSDLSFPIITLDTFDCSTDTVTLSVVNDPNIMYQWNDGQVDIGTLNELMIVDTGNYYLTVIDQSGCEARYVYHIPIDLTFTPASLPPRDTLNCLDSIILLAPEISTPAMDFTWRRNGRPYSMDSLIEIRESGNYRLNIVYSSLCSENLISRISNDTVTPQVNLLSFDSLTCTNQFVDLVVESIESLDYNWYFEDIFLVNDSIISISSPGVYVVSGKGDNYCSFVDTARVLQDTIAPVFNIIGDTINCAASKIELAVNNTPLDWLFEWTGPLNFIATDSLVTVRDTGIYELEVTSLNGCTSIKDFHVFGDFDLPESIARGGSLNCIDSSLELFGSSATSDVSQLWFGPNGFVSDTSRPIITDTGIYVLLTTGTNGCSVRDTVIVDNMPPAPDAQIMLDIWDCSTLSLPVQASSLDTGVIFTWVGPNNYAFEGDAPVLPSFGDYIITYTGVNGCMTIIDTVIPTDTLRPFVDIYTNQLFSCEQRIITINGDNSDIGSEFSYIWSTDDGLILSDTSNVNILIGDTAVYILQVTNERNHCVNRSDFEVIESPSSLLGVFFTTTDYGCINGFNGQIVIDSLDGGGPPVMFSYDDEPFVGNFGFDHLLPGYYPMELRDTFGCRLDTGFTIYDSLYLNLSLQKDTTIKLGDSITLFPSITNLINPDDAQFLWSPSIGINCIDCIESVVMPLVTTQYCVQVSTDEGCVSTECVLVKVMEENQVYVPNAFTPNGDDLNDRLIPKASQDIANIELFQIYNRWGNLVYSEQNVLPNDIRGWDGNFEDQVMTPQVLVYRLVYTTLSNKKVEESGDITLLR